MTTVANGHLVDTSFLPTLRASAARTRTLRDWVALVCLMVASAAILFYNLTSSGYANDFYSAAAQAGSVNWEAFLWGSLDAGNAITVDKPPAALWLMALSIRAFGLSSFAILLPEVLCGLLSIYVLYASVRRYWGNWAGIIAGAVLATTPVAVLMFRFNNPDALLVLLMTCATAAVLRALEYDNTKRDNRKRTLWMILAGACIGLGFLTKQMQVFLVVPGFAVVFLLASPTSWWRRIVDGLAAVAAVIVSAGWWVLLTVIVPASERPYIGGSQTNSFLELTFGYNGLGRLTGNETGSVIPGGGGSGAGTYAHAGAQGVLSGYSGAEGMPGAMGGGSRGGNWGETGWTRLFDGVFGGQIAWLAPIAFAGIILAILVTRQTLRTDLRRASALIWSAWLVVTWITFSFMAGIFHQYYTVALAPAVAAMVAIAVSVLWMKRETFWARLCTTVLVLGSTIWAYTLLARSTWMPVLRWTVLGVGIAAVLLLAWSALSAWPMPEMRALRSRGMRRVTTISGGIGVVLATVALAIGPVAWSAYTISTGHQGSIVTAGPAVSGSDGFGAGHGAGGMGGPQGAGNFGEMNNGPTSNGTMPTPPANNTTGQNAQEQGSQNQGTQSQNTQSQGAQGQGMMGGAPPAAPNGAQQGSASAAPQGNAQNGAQGNTSSGNADGTQSESMQHNGGFSKGGLLGGGSASSAITSLLSKNSSSYRWVAATTGSQNAASYQLATQLPVMAIGGFNGSDPAPTLAQFKSYVQQGLIHYYIAGGGMGGSQMGGSNVASQIATWVSEHYTATTVDGVTVYDLTQAAK